MLIGLWFQCINAHTEREDVTTLRRLLYLMIIRDLYFFMKSSDKLCVACELNGICLSLKIIATLKRGLD